MKERVAMDLSKFQFKRVNPFQGLVIDADIWQDAHNYHRAHQKLHVLAFHKPGIIDGLEVSANSPADASVNISQGLAVDPEGNIIVVPQNQHYRVQTRAKGIIFLVIQFREIPTEPFQPPEGGQATRVLEAYRIQERDALPAEPYVELARIDFDPGSAAIKDARNSAKAGINEINLAFRLEGEPGTQTPVVPQPKVIPAPSPPSQSKETLTIGYMVLGDARKDLHLKGLRNLVRDLNRQGAFTAVLEEDSNFKKSLARLSYLYMTGTGRFDLTAEQQAALGTFIQSGGIVFGDVCSQVPAGADARGTKEFGLAFNKLASALNSKLGIVQRGHSLLDSNHVFSEVPQGCEPGMLLEGGSMIYSGSDFGCAFDGGHADKPLSREVIRSAFEMWTNIITYYQGSKISRR
jgi:hypothetical protein